MSNIHMTQKAMPDLAFAYLSKLIYKHSPHCSVYWPLIHFSVELCPSFLECSENICEMQYHAMQT